MNSMIPVLLFDVTSGLVNLTANASSVVSGIHMKCSVMNMVQHVKNKVLNRNMIDR